MGVAEVRVEQPDTRCVKWDCPWVGHIPIPGVQMRLGNLPLMGMICIKCGCNFFTKIETSSILGPDGKVLITKESDDA